MERPRTSRVPYRSRWCRFARGRAPGADPAVVAAFWARTASLSRSMTAASQAMKEAHERLRRLETALDRSTSAPAALDDQLDDLRRTLDGLREALYGNATRGELEKAQTPTVQGRLGFAQGHLELHLRPNACARREPQVGGGVSKVRADLNRFLTEELPAFEANLRAAGAPWSMRAAHPIGEPHPWRARLRDAALSGPAHEEPEDAESDMKDIKSVFRRLEKMLTQARWFRTIGRSTTVASTCSCTRHMVQPVPGRCSLRDVHRVSRASPG